jgi:Holliday junction resolvase RusA-like endonuclease
MILNIKPLSVNKAWQGRRVKSKEYRKYESDILKLLRPMNIPDGPLELYLKWGFSSAGSDWDNPIKPFQDCLQKKYNFNDNRVVRAVTEKIKVKKGDEFIEFEIKGLK